MGQEFDISQMRSRLSEVSQQISHVIRLLEGLPKQMVKEYIEQMRKAEEEMLDELSAESDS